MKINNIVFILNFILIIWIEFYNNVKLMVNYVKYLNYIRVFYFNWSLLLNEMRDNLKY